ncbi:cytochrome-c oxidase chain VIIc [Apiospora kogelbergensis]|uniref:Cytochrome c oxidase subunit 8, mitochondrial n=1 Tax=Apiospora kogelbergensis TaxID=1337665 RepID=A0AAW0R691_9PEZI
MGSQHSHHLHSVHSRATPFFKMSPQSILRASPRAANMISRRMFHATRARLSSPYHYSEGPYSNLPFNTKTRFFAVRYWAYMITGFFAPFGIAVWQTYKPKA